MSIEGTWNPSVSSPVGEIEAAAELRERDGPLTGVAHGADEGVPRTGISPDGDRTAWKQAVAEPARQTPALDATGDGDTLRDASRAGRLPSSKGTGERRTTPEHQA